MSGEISRVPLDIVGLPEGGPALPILTVTEYPSKYDFNPTDIGAGLAALGFTVETLRNTQVYMRRGPLPKVEGPSMDVAGLYYPKPWGAHEVVLGVMVDDGKGGEREQTEDELNFNFWHELAHVLARQEQLDQHSRLLGPLARARVSRLMGRFSHASAATGAAVGSVSGGVDVNLALRMIDAPTGLEHNPALRLAIVLGAAASSSVGFGVLAKKVWNGITSFTHRKMHGLDPAERYANQHAAIYAKHFKAIRTCDNQ